MSPSKRSAERMIAYLETRRDETLSPAWRKHFECQLAYWRNILDGIA